MAFDDLTKEQRRAMIELAAELSTGRYAPEVAKLASFIGEVSFRLQGRVSNSSRVMNELTLGDLVAIEDKGYVVIRRDEDTNTIYSFTLTDKAQAEYDLYLHEKNSDAYYERVWLDIFRAAGGRADRPVVITEAIRGEAINEDEAWRLADYFAGKEWFVVEADNGSPFGRLTQLGLEAAQRIFRPETKVQPTSGQALSKQITVGQRQTLQEWAGADEGAGTQLSLVFTDVVGSTAMAQSVGDEEWIQIISAHFKQAHKLADKHGGFIIKLIGDACMVAFRGSVKAFNFTKEFYVDPGHPELSIRAAINTGHVYMMGDDIYGMMVNLTARIQKEISGFGIGVSSHVASDLRNAFGQRTPNLRLMPFPRGIPNFREERAYLAHTPEVIKANAEQRKRKSEAERAEAASKSHPQQQQPKPSASGIRPRTSKPRPK